MKKLLFIGLFALTSLLSTAQNLVPKTFAKAYVIFPANNSFYTWYEVENGTVLVNEATIAESITINASSLKLVGFTTPQFINPNIWDFVSKPSLPQAPVIVNPQPDNQIGNVKLNIPGYAEVSDIFLSEEILKHKDPNRLNIQLATHSISLGENIGEKRSIVNYKITDQTGKVWVEVFQKQPTVEGRLGGLFGNNHPDKQYLPQLSEDCNVFLPLGNIYTIQVENRGDLVVDFWVHFPWSSDGTERRLHREDLGSGTAYYSIDTNLLGLRDMPDYQRTIKINVNGKL
ncbi:hypothetical protein [Emticicia sp. BO119]|uniref:hypothetical protein n=1 Tax=Emticicia sp. BO119 TaxID=2757768 RepID=UPI0015F0DF80|nr:hypothetical protein [Emticicia sp. BO119]MBA4852091.1 hypothetical protein [Emticicia sp. BO119]